MYTTIQDKAGSVVFHKNLPTIEALRDALHPFRRDVAVGVESTFNWYWLSDACRKEGIPFYLGHAQVPSIGGRRFSWSEEERLSTWFLLKKGRGNIGSSPPFLASSLRINT